MIALDHTHDPAVRSWIDSANAVGTDFPIQNLPFSVFRRRGTQETYRGGVAIGEQILDLAALTATSALDGLALQAARAAAKAALNDFFALGPDAWRSLRHALFVLLHEHAAPARVSTVRSCLVAQGEAEHTVPARIGDFTDCYTSLDHARNCMRIMYPDADVTTNFRWMPQAYHGRVSTIGVSGQQFHRPMGQSVPAGASTPVFLPSARMDYELELGIWIGQGNAMGKSIALDHVDEHIFGISLLNDWSARDIQVWEMTPLGPFHAKNFATTVAPWIVTADALAPFRTAWTCPVADPQPLPYLESSANREAGALDIRLEVSLQSERARREGRGPARLSGTSFRHQYWSIGQMVAHHTAGGCNLNPGDLIGSGTISGPGPGEAGAMIELAHGGQKPVSLGDGDERGFLQDGDTVVMHGWCEKPGAARIGFGECRGTVLPALVI